MKLRKSLVYFLIFTILAAFLSYKVIVKAYGDVDRYDIENLKS